MTKFCVKHILEEQGQVLFRPCGVATPADGPCETPVANLFPHSTCVFHTKLQPFAVSDKLESKSGGNSSKEKSNEDDQSDSEKNESKESLQKRKPNQDDSAMVMSETHFEDNKAPETTKQDKIEDEKLRSNPNSKNEDHIDKEDLSKEVEVTLNSTEHNKTTLGADSEQSVLENQSEPSITETKKEIDREPLTTVGLGDLDPAMAVAQSKNATEPCKPDTTDQNNSDAVTGKETAGKNISSGSSEESHTTSSQMDKFCQDKDDPNNKS